MALQMNLPAARTAVGLDAPEAYARIVAFAFDAKTSEVQVAVDVHANAAARHAGKNPISGGVFKGQVGVDTPDLDASITGVRAALYGWLKTLPDFAGAEDV